MADAVHGLTPGLVGAGVALVLVGAFASLVLVTDTSLGNTFGWPIWLVLYPLSPLIGYDLATRGGVAGDGGLLRLGGYSVAVAAAHLTMALALAVCVAADLDGWSPLWNWALASCIVAAVPARTVAVRRGRGLHGAPLGAAGFIFLIAWIVFFVAAGFELSRADS